MIVMAGGLAALLAVESGGSRPARRTAPVRRAIEVPEEAPPFGCAPGCYSVALRIEASSGDPAAGAEIELSGPTSRGGSADGNGLFDAADLAPGFYTLRARLGSEAGGLRFDLSGTTHLGTLRLAGTVEVRGTVRGPDGAPLGGALVEATEVWSTAILDPARLGESMLAPDAALAQARSSDSGTYSLHLPEGVKFGFRASAQGCAPHRIPGRSIRAGMRIDFHLAAGATVAGVVVDERGRPVAHANVLVLEPARLLEGLPKAEAVSDPDGAFELAFLADSSPSLTVRAPGFAPWVRSGLKLPATGLRVELERGITVRLRAVEEEHPDRAAPRVSVAVDLQGGFGSGSTGADGEIEIAGLPARRDPDAGTDQVILWGRGFAPRVHEIPGPIPSSGVLDLGDLPIGRGGVVTGRVLDSANGRPVTGAAVHAFGGVPPVIALATTHARSGPDGTYRLEGVPLDATALVAIHPEYAAPEGLNALLSGLPPESGGPLFVSGLRTAVRDLLLSPGGSIRGTVRTAAGGTAAGALVLAIAPETEAGALVGAARVEATTDAEGRFLLSRLPDGPSLMLEATHPDLGASLRTPARIGVDVELILAPGVTLRGRVIDESGTAVRGARVSFETSGGALAIAATDSTGAWMLQDATPGTGLLRVSHPERLGLEREWTIPPAPAEQVLGPLLLARGPAITGTVLLPGGAPAVGVEVTARLESASDSTGAGRFWAETTSDERGRFVLGGLAAGRYRIAARRRGLSCRETAAETDGAPAMIALSPGVTLRGRVVAGGAPVNGARVEVEGPGEAEDAPHCATTGEGGRFAVEGLLADARFDVTVQHDAYADARFEGIGTDVGEVEFTLEPGVQVGGAVEMEDGTPVPDALIEVRAGGRPHAVVRSAEGGRFLAGGLPAGQPIELKLLESGRGFLGDEPVPAQAGERSMRLVARRGGSITGMVSDSAGRPLGRVRVDALDSSGDLVGSQWIEEPGRGFAFRGLGPGRYTLRAEAAVGEGAEPARAELPGVREGTSRVELRLDLRR